MILYLAGPTSILRELYSAMRRGMPGLSLQVQQALGRDPHALLTLSASTIVKEAKGFLRRLEIASGHHPSSLSISTVLIPVNVSTLVHA